jgi:hypothetical protein
MAFTQLTTAQLKAEISDLSSEILAKRRGIAQYTIHTGQGSQSVSNRSIKELMSLLKELEFELQNRSPGGIIATDFVRSI